MNCHTKIRFRDHQVLSAVKKNMANFVRYKNCYPLYSVEKKEYSVFFTKFYAPKKENIFNHLPHRSTSSVFMLGIVAI